ncbi:MAG: glutathione-disulfide reductase [Myxococcales bacterium]|nr:glutathione-disulfide reductase [Myxococcales bacterium]
MTDVDVDLFVIGGGSGGVRAARIAATHGARVAIAEEHRWGGTCVIRGCVPKKLLVYASEFAHAFDDARGFGWEVGPVRHDWAALIAAKDREIARLSGLYQGNLERHGVVRHDGRATLVDAHTVAIGGARVRAGHILIATGGRPVRPRIPGAELFITSDEAFHLPTLPARIAIVGGGYIGVEFAHIFRGLGAEVTLIHRRDRVLAGFDDDLRDAVEAGLARAGVVVRAGGEPRAVRRAADGAIVLELDGAEVVADVAMAATGRAPHTAGLGLEAAGVAVDARGAIAVDAWSQTSAPSVYAVGDVTGRVALTPVAIREGHAFADTVFGGKAIKIDHELIATAVFAQPAAAAVGLSEAAAIARGHDVQIYATKFRPMKHTMTGRGDQVFLKLVVDRVTGVVLGVHMVAAEAPEIIQAVAIAVTMGATKDDFDRTFAVHPTAAEELVLLR